MGRIAVTASRIGRAISTGNNSRRSCLLLFVGSVVLFMSILGLLLQPLDWNMHEQSSSSSSSSNVVEPHLLEELFYKYGSDKSHDDHSYTDLYQMILDPIRLNVQEMMEVGISAGQSIQGWYHYFPKATIHAFDVNTLPSVPKIVDQLKDRVVYKEMDLLRKDLDLRNDLNLQDNSIDVLVEDAMHTPQQQQQFLVRLFPLVKPGGYYIIEDICYNRDPCRLWHRAPEKLNPMVQKIMQDHDTIFVDTHVGHRAWNEYRTKARSVAKSHWEHNSYLLVIRKRVKTPRPPVQMNAGSRAMNANKVVLDETM